MPSKHNPPSDSSSSSEEEEEEEEEIVKASQHVEEEDSDEEESDEEPQPTPKPTPNSNSNSTSHKPPSNDESDSEEEEEEEHPTPPLKPSKPQPKESDSEDSEESDSDSPTPTKTPAPLDIKPISSKPMPSSLTKPIVMSLASTTKRPAETEPSRRDKKKKKKVLDLIDHEKNGQNDKKNMFQRIWTEEDEIVILKGMASFKKKGVDINSHLPDFVDSIKDSLHNKDVSKTQVHSKTRSLKKKFQTVVKKTKPGEEPRFLKPHDAKLYQLSMKLWKEEVGKDEEDNGKDVKKSNESKKMADTVVASPKAKVAALPNNSTTTKEGVKDEYMYLSDSSIAPKISEMPVPPLGLGDVVSKRGWDMIGSSKAQKFDQRWKSVIIAETKAYLQRLDLVKEQTQAVLDALESSDV